MSIYLYLLFGTWQNGNRTIVKPFPGVGIPSSERVKRTWLNKFFTRVMKIPTYIADGVIAYSMENVDHTRVVLMFGERSFGFQPNILQDTDQGSLEQMWFDGSHGDAWGPSLLSLPILAYILSHLEATEVTIDYKCLFVSLQKCKKMPPMAPPPLPKVFSGPRRCSPPVRGSQYLHPSLVKNQPWIQQYTRPRKEINILAMLMAIVNPNELLSDSDLVTAVIQFVIPKLGELSVHLDVQPVLSNLALLHHPVPLSDTGNPVSRGVLESLQAGWLHKAPLE
ncbi:hypothetical protein B0H11DRAFT_1921481 [Mycena galericulata]|nr:hypothetical protein B0H11DRAFT_1921481 [Mycena galericulata]